MAFVEQHLPCPDCGSSDGLSIDDGGWSICFVCEKKTPPAGGSKMTVDFKKGEYGPLTDRSISSETAKKYRVTKSPDKHFYPYFTANEDGTTGTQCSVKIRGVKDKTFVQEGDPKKAGLFGQNVFTKDSGKYITLTEGECDAMAAHELLGSKYPVVSVTSSSSAVKDCKKAYKYLDNFERIYLCFDMDEPGQKAAHNVAELFPGKCYLMKMTLKDANEYLKNSQHHEFNKAFWGSTRLTPDSIVSGDSMWELVSQVDETEFIPYPWKELNKVTYGLRLDEMVTITAGSGMGKTQIMREMQHFFLSKTDYNVGCLMLEEPLKSAGLGVMSIEANKILHLPRREQIEVLRFAFGDDVFDDAEGVDVTDDELKEYYDKTLGTGRIHFYNAFGESDINKLISSIKYLAKAMDCKIIFLDHISIVVSEQSNGDERKALDEIATKLKKLTIELGIALIMVSHAKRQATKPLEEGGSTSLSDIRGTAGIGQLSNIVLGLERNGQADDPVERNTTLIRVIKNRFTGITGPASMLHYDKDTGRLNEVDEEYLNMLKEIGDDEE